MMSSINFLTWVLEATGIFVGCFALLALSTFIHNRIKRKSWEAEDTAELSLGIVCTIASIVLFCIVPNDKTKIEMFYIMKPKCQEETVSCLSKKVEWYKDSVEYNIAPKINEKLLIDSLKNVINNYEKGKN